VKEKICLITGGTSGIGWVTARELARMGAEVILAARNADRGRETVDQIRRLSNGAKVEFIPLDLSSWDDIRRFALEVHGRFPRLDVLINNAGTMLLQRRVNQAGLEMTFVVNHLGHFLLTHMLMELLRASESARVIVISSGSHWRARLDFDDLQNENGYSGMRVYGESKLANLLFTYELARRLEGESITANAMHPGFVRTNLGRDNGWLLHKLIRLVMLAAGTAEAGADTCIYLASSDEVEGVSGKYFKGRKAVRSSKASYNLEEARKLWEISEEILGLTEEERLTSLRNSPPG
jgi:NAD(P)-dependent dehydrogenase (short-subunit alcohol dehydrogenase family)